MFLPVTKKEMQELGWDTCDIILVTGDVYIDSPYIGVSIIGKILLKEGFKVGIISQPDIDSDYDITRLGEPALFWGVTSGSLDSMVANYTATGKKRKQDDLTPGEINNRRPDRAVIVYSNLIRKYFKNTKPVVLGGIEASLRRIAHYDYHDNQIRRSILFDAKADYLIYGMAEKTILEFANRLKIDKDVKDIRGLCYISEKPVTGYIQLPSYEEVKKDKEIFIKMFEIFYLNNDPLTAKGLFQKQDTRYLIQNPPAFNLTTDELDKIYEIDYERDVHPYYKKYGRVRALETIQFSITTHRGCFGECNFCSIAVHQGRTVISRSKESIIREVKNFLKHPDFKGIISDVGGPTANMYSIECQKKLKYGSCKHRRCLFPDICKNLNINHQSQIELLREIRKISGIKKVFITSGIRHDMVIADMKKGNEYLEELIKYHISGQLKIAPEHIQKHITNIMGKPDKNSLIEFKNLFFSLNRKFNKKQFLTYYFIAGHPGCTKDDMKELAKFVKKELKITPEQVQIFTPLPSVYSTLMYWTEFDPFSKKNIFVEKNNKDREEQKRIIIDKR